jgi:hypothetical protein
MPAPPGGQEPDPAEVRAWLGELNRLKDEPGAPDEVTVRVLEHIELATVYLGLETDLGSNAGMDPRGVLGSPRPGAHSKKSARSPNKEMGTLRESGS